MVCPNQSLKGFKPRFVSVNWLVGQKTEELLSQNLLKVSFKLHVAGQHQHT